MLVNNSEDEYRKQNINNTILNIREKQHKKNESEEKMGNKHEIITTDAPYTNFLNKSEDGKIKLNKTYIPTINENNDKNIIEILSQCFICIFLCFLFLFFCS